MRVITVVTTSRADYGIYLPLLRKINNDSDLELRLIVSGAHLSPEFGYTVKEIEADGFHVDDCVEVLLSSDSPIGVSKAMGLGVLGFTEIFSRYHPDVLVVLGDRFEMHSAALAALPFRISVAHIHGGEVTMGAIDDSLRHSMTKLSHLHFVSTSEYAQRVIQLGEEPWRVVISGAPSLDNLDLVALMSPEAFSTRTGFSAVDPFLLVTFHPVTLEFDKAAEQTNALVSALERVAMPVLITLPNADTGGRAVRDVLLTFSNRSSYCKAVDNLGTQAYFSAMRYAAAMIGNSSSGIVEAASFGMPVVNIGSRQEGRVRGDNVIDVGCRSEEIVKGINTALDANFKNKLTGMKNPYGDGRASERIVEMLKAVDLDKLFPKRFFDISGRE